MKITERKPIHIRLILFATPSDCPLIIGYNWNLNIVSKKALAYNSKVVLLTAPTLNISKNEVFTRERP